MNESWRETQRHACIDEWLWWRVSGVGTVITIHMALQEWGPFTPDTGSTASRLHSALSRRKPPSLHLTSFPGQPTSDNWSAWGCEHWALFTRLRRALKAHPSFRSFSGSTEGSTDSLTATCPPLPLPSWGAGHKLHSHEPPLCLAGNPARDNVRRRGRKKWINSNVWDSASFQSDPSNQICITSAESVCQKMSPFLGGSDRW